VDHVDYGRHNTVRISAEIGDLPVSWPVRAENYVTQSDLG